MSPGIADGGCGTRTAASGYGWWFGHKRHAVSPEGPHPSRGRRHGRHGDDDAEGRVRTAADFDGVYAKPDPWGVAQEPRRDRTLARIIAPYVEGKTVLDLGCGEGHLTAAVFQSAAWVTAIDISQVAIQRTPRLANARFAATDFMSPDVSVEGQDVITALECIQYL